ncbi:MAG: serine/threonine-protein kinase [Pseudomonadota bacterium]
MRWKKSWRRGIRDRERILFGGLTITMITSDKIGRYEIEKILGWGGFATVYLGHDPYIKRPVALKISEVGTDNNKRTALENLFQEAEAAGSLIHPNIVTIFDAGIEGPFCYIAMEYIEGESLADKSAPDHLLPIADALDIMVKVCHGLDYAHQHGIIHRDVKPGNILIGSNGDIKIADFGLAFFAGLADRNAPTAGTPAYMSPEQVMGRDLKPQSDLFSAGIVLYRLLCGQNPFEGASPPEIWRKIVEDPYIPLSDRNAALPPKLFGIIEKALAKDPNDRYHSGFELARDIESVLCGSKMPSGNKLSKHMTHLKSLHFFEDFDDEEIAGLLSIGAWLTYKDGDTIIREDEKGGAFFVIVSGAAAVKVGEREMARISRGNCFGEMSFLIGCARSASVIATEECNLLRLNPEKIEILDVKLQMKLYRLFSRTLATHLLKMDGKVKLE